MTERRQLAPSYLCTTLPFGLGGSSASTLSTTPTTTIDPPFVARKEPSKPTSPPRSLASPASTLAAVGGSASPTVASVRTPAPPHSSPLPSSAPTASKRSSESLPTPFPPAFPSPAPAFPPHFFWPTSPYVPYPWTPSGVYPPPARPPIPQTNDAAAAAAASLDSRTTPGSHSTLPPPHPASYYGPPHPAPYYEPPPPASYYGSPPPASYYGSPHPAPYYGLPHPAYYGPPHPPYYLPPPLHPVYYASPLCYPSPSFPPSGPTCGPPYAVTPRTDSNRQAVATDAANDTRRAQTEPSRIPSLVAAAPGTSAPSAATSTSSPPSLPLGRASASLVVSAPLGVVPAPVSAEAPVVTQRCSPPPPPCRAVATLSAIADAGRDASDGSRTILPRVVPPPNHTVRDPVPGTMPSAGLPPGPCPVPAPSPCISVSNAPPAGRDGTTAVVGLCTPPESRVEPRPTTAPSPQAATGEVAWSDRPTPLAPLPPLLPLLPMQLPAPARREASSRAGTAVVDLTEVSNSPEPSPRRYGPIRRDTAARVVVNPYRVRTLSPRPPVPIFSDAKTAVNETTKAVDDTTKRDRAAADMLDRIAAQTRAPLHAPISSTQAPKKHNQKPKRPVLCSTPQCSSTFSSPKKRDDHLKLKRCKLITRKRIAVPSTAASDPTVLAAVNL